MRVVWVAGILKQQLLKELDRRFGEQGFKRFSDRFYGDRYDRAISGGRPSIALASHTRKTTWYSIRRLQAFG